jgi:hypothetical protein
MRSILGIEALHGPHQIFVNFHQPYPNDKSAAIQRDLGSLTKFDVTISWILASQPHLNIFLRVEIRFVKFSHLNLNKIITNK